MATKKTADTATGENTLAPVIQNFHMYSLGETECSQQSNSKPSCLDAPQIPLPVSAVTSSKSALLISSFFPNGRMIPDGEEQSPIDQDCEKCNLYERELEKAKKEKKAEKEKYRYTMEVMTRTSDDNFKELPLRYEEVMELFPSSTRNKEQKAGEIVNKIAKIKMRHKRSISCRW